MTFFNNHELKNYPDTLDVNHLKEILMIGDSLVYKLLKDNKIKNLRIGKKIIIAKSSVIDYLNSLFATKGEPTNGQATNT
ncbi:MAG: helix-turn-helix domain-containing protein [Firmicutes bacterium]|nr:helix-turn-helix domain-containing protein [Bacillota bacterium]